VRDVGEGDVVWQVQDTGGGKSERGLAELGHPPHTAEPEGPGRGVALAQAVVEAHGGVLRFESARGVGTTATIWVPRPIEQHLDA
jgi:signal transduction histidine kinase